MSSRREALRLQDIIDNADAIRDYLAGVDFEAFSSERMRVDAVERALERLIERSSKSVRNGCSRSHPTCRWSKFAASAIG